MTIPILVSSGEASGDRMAALAIEALGARARTSGMGGSASAQAGLDELVPRDIQGIMGVTGVVKRWRSVVRTHRELLGWARLTRPGAALLVGFTSFHERLGRDLRLLGIPVLWCAAPQVWAWRASRLRTMRCCADQLAVVLPFEEELWRSRGHDAVYVGHPASESVRWHQGSSQRLAVLCGSRDQEAESLGRSLVSAAKAWIHDNPRWSADVLMPPSLRADLSARLRAHAAQAGLGVVNTSSLHGAATVLHQYDLALCASGTASLEAALSNCPPVVVYRTTPALRLAAAALLKVRDIALPNIVLGRRVFPEIVEDRPAERNLLDSLEAVRSHRARLAGACQELRDRMLVHGAQSFGSRIAELLLAWADRATAWRCRGDKHVRPSRCLLW